MKINYEFLKKIFNKKIKLKKKSDKIKLSNYSEYIPMYDIYSKNIYLIKNIELHYRLEESHYRFINDEIINWIKNSIKKEKNKENLDKYNNIIDIMSNYDLDILEENSYKSVYKYSPRFGLSISICRRKSFHPYISNLKPYYSKFELIKLGQNMGIIKKMDSIKLIDKDLHYKICKKVSNNDISRDEILEFNKNIIKNKSIGWLCNYSFTGSYILNNFLRNKDRNSISKTNYDGLNKIIKTIEKSPSFKNDYFFYRFIINDDFLMNLKIGDIFEDDGIISSTRDPFYNPNIIQEDFGFILIKINIPRNVKGFGCLIENFSLFPKEEELIIKPNSKLKLISKDDKFKYYHVNDEFENLIKKKYEFKLIGTNSKKYENIKYFDGEIPEIDLLEIEFNNNDRYNMFTNFIHLTNEVNEFLIKINDKKLIFNYQWFDSRTTYSELFYNNIKEGLLITYQINGYPYLSIECGDELVVNYIKKFYFYDEINDSDKINQKDVNYLISLFGKIFKYKEAKVFFNYNNFSKITKDESDIKYFKLYCKPIYDYLKKGKKFSTDNTIEYNFSYWKLDKVVNKKVPKDINEKLNNDLKNLSWKKLIIEIVENYYYLYEKLEFWLNKFCENLIKDSYLKINIKNYLNSKGIKYNFPLDMEYSNKKIESKYFKKIFKENIRIK